MVLSLTDAAFMTRTYTFSLIEVTDPALHRFSVTQCLSPCVSYTFTFR